MSSTQVVVTILTAVLGLIGGASSSALISAVSRRHVTEAEADSLMVEQAVKLMANQDEQIARAELERGRMEAEIRALRSDLELLREYQREERLRCDTDLATLRSELIELALMVHPDYPVPKGPDGTPRRRKTDMMHQSGHESTDHVVHHVEGDVGSDSPTTSPTEGEPHAE